MRCAEHDRGRTSKKDSVTATQHRLVVKRIAESKAWAKVIAIAHGRRRVQTGSRERQAGIIHRWLGHVLQVVSQAEIQCELRSYAPVILNKQAKLLEVRVGGTS